MKKQILKIVDVILCIYMYLVAIISISRNLALNAFLFSQLGCIWYFISLNKHVKEYLNKYIKYLNLKRVKKEAIKRYNEKSSRSYVAIMDSTLFT